ncbi:hypothetical protein [Plectonema radiosum]|uniref:hypothetical protein n=1 Tax=Plectonema radiosum TaxID=945768 RepID=UPI00405562F3
MDEPFGALDALTRGKLQRQVLDIWENHRQAVMMITQYFELRNHALNFLDKYFTQDE